MISIGPPPIVTPTTPARKVEESERVANSKQLADAPKQPSADRRRNKDRRRKDRKGQFLDLRSGRDRRNPPPDSDKPTSIDIIA